MSKMFTIAQGPEDHAPLAKDATESKVSGPGSIYDSDKISVRLLSEADRERWDGYVKACRSSSNYHLTVWKEIIERCFGHRTYYLLSEDAQGRVCGILPLVHLKSAIFGSFLVSMPYFNYGGICADNDDAARLLLEKAVDIASKEKAAHIELRHALPFEGGLPAKTTKVSMRLKLEPSPELLWKGFPSKLRSQIKKPEKLGMLATIGRLEELDGFYRVLSANMRDLGTPVYPKGFFRTMLELSKDTWISTVYKNGEPVASGFLAGFKDTLEIPWASSIRKYNSLGPNMLMYWNSLKFACEMGYRTFDFGRSTPDEGTFAFKKQWGAVPLQLYWHYWIDGGGPLPEINPKNPKYRMAISVWRKMPVWLTRIIGPAIVKNIP